MGVRNFGVVLIKALSDDSHGPGDAGEQIIGGFVGLHGQIGQSFQDQFVVSLDGIFLFEKILEVRPEQPDAVVGVPIDYG